MSAPPSQPYYPLYVGEMLAATATWDGEERALLLLLLALAWASGAPLPADPSRLAKICSYDAERFVTLWQTVAAQFEQHGAGLINARLEQLRVHARTLQEQRMQASSKGVAARRKASPSDVPSGQPSGQPSDVPSGQPHDSPLGQPIRSGQDREGLREESGVSLSRHSRAHARTASVTPTKFEQQVIDGYHRILPDLPGVKVWTRTRQNALRSRIAERLRDGKQADAVAYWEEFFLRVAASDFLCGRSGEWRCSLEWLLRPAKFLSVIEGAYDNRSRRANGGHAYVG